MTPALPTLAPSQTVPATPANQPPATLQPTESLTNPSAAPSTTTPSYGQGAGGSYGGPSYGQPAGTPMTAGTGQPIIDARSLTRGDNAPTAFRALDPMNRGYVTRADADKLDGFIGWFDNADTDRDGRLTPEEFQNAWKSYAR